MKNYLVLGEFLDRPKKLVHHLHLGEFKLTKFASNVPDLADRIDDNFQPNEPLVIVSTNEESMHVFGFKWDHNKKIWLLAGVL